MKSCPECGSTNIAMKYGGKLGRLWICKKCGWQGRTIVDFPDETLKKMKHIEKAKKLERKMKKFDKMSQKYY
jgi:transposase-like protein